MTRKELFEKKRQEIKKEVDITEAVSQNNFYIQTFTSQINKISNKILPKNYKTIFKSKSISVEDQVSTDGLEELIKVNSLVKKADLNSFLKDYEYYSENKMKEKTFSLDKKNILINLPPETLPYQRADDRIEQFTKLNLKLREFEHIAADKMNLMIITLKQISEIKNSNTKASKEILKEKQRKISSIEKEISEMEPGEDLRQLNPDLFENIKVVQYKYNESLRAKKFITFTFWASLILSLLTVAIIITLIVRVTEV